MITPRNERLHPHNTHQAAGNRKGSREGGLREPLCFGASFLTGIPRRQVTAASYTGLRRAYAVRSIDLIFCSDGLFYMAFP